MQGRDGGFHHTVSANIWNTSVFSLLIALNYIELHCTCFYCYFVHLLYGTRQTQYMTYVFLSLSLSSPVFARPTVLASAQSVATDWAENCDCCCAALPLWPFNLLTSHTGLRLIDAPSSGELGAFLFQILHTIQETTCQTTSIMLHDNVQKDV